MNTDFKLQILHSGEIFATKEIAEKHIRKYLEDNILIGEPAVAFYGTDTDNPNVILCIGNGKEKNSVYLVDFQEIKDKLASLTTAEGTDADDISLAMIKIEGILKAVGLSCNEINGEWVVSYDPDPTDKVIGSAESIADALAKLSDYAQSVAVDSQFVTENSDSVELTKEDQVLKAVVKISKLGETSITEEDDNILGVFSDGLYAVAHLSYDSTKDELTFTTSGYDENGDFKRDANKETIQLGAHTQYEGYNKGHDIEVTVDNEKMQISADVKISDNNNNILDTTDSGLYVGGKASNIKYQNTTVLKAINDLYDKVDDAAKKTEYVDSDTVKFTTKEDANGELNVSADVKLADNNSINISDGGLNVNLDISVNSNNKLVVKLGDTTKRITLPGIDVIDLIEFKDGYLIIYYNGSTKQVEVPLEGLIAHYVFDTDEHSANSIHFDNEMDSDGVYHISANVKLRSSDNLIEHNSEGELYVSKETVEAIVSGVSDDIIKRVDTLETKVSDLETANVGIVKDIEQLQKDVDTNADKISANTSDIAEIKTKISNDEANFSALAEQVKANMSGIQTNANAISALENEVKGVENNIKLDEQTIEYLTSEVEDVEKTVADVQTEVFTNTTNIAALTTRTDTLDKEVATLNADAETVGSVQHTVKVAKDIVEMELSNETERATAAEDSLQGQIDSLSAQLSGDEESILANAKTYTDDQLGTIKLEQSTESSLVYTLYVQDKNCGTINIPEDQFLKSVTYNRETKDLIFVFYVRDEEGKGSEETVEINIGDLVDIYTNGDGLNLEDNVFSIKINSDSESYLKVDEDGLSVEGIAAIAKSVAAETQRAQNEEDSIKSDVTALKYKTSNIQDLMVLKANDSEGYVNWDRDAGVYFGDEHKGDDLTNAAGQYVKPMLLAYTVGDDTYQYCIDGRTGVAYHRHAEVPSDSSLGGHAWSQAYYSTGEVDNVISSLTEIISDLSTTLNNLVESVNNLDERVEKIETVLGTDAFDDLSKKGSVGTRLNNIEDNILEQIVDLDTYN